MPGPAMRPKTSRRKGVVSAKTAVWRCERSSPRVVQAARREQAVGGGLCLQVGEVAGLEPTDQHVPIGVQQFVERSAAAFLTEDTPDTVAQKPGLGRHPFREFARVVNRRRIGGEERIEHRLDPLNAGPVGNNPALTVEPSNPCSLAGLARRVPAKLQIIGQDQVGQPLAVAPQLLVLLDAVQIGTDILAFDMTDRDAVALDDEVGSAAGDLGGFVEGANAGPLPELARGSGAPVDSCARSPGPWRMFARSRGDRRETQRLCSRPSQTLYLV